MRFTKENKLYMMYVNGKRKQETKFLWLPVTINYETRWLETATIEYKVDYEYTVFGSKSYFWKPWVFINK
jgi:hypothetical protein